MPTAATRFILFLILPAVAGCRGDPPIATDAVLDDDGRAVHVEGSATRIVSLSPGLTELLFALGAGDRVVGRTRWGSDPPEAEAVASVGDGLAPNVEVVLARRPDLVVFYRSPSNAAAISRLEDLGVATASLALDQLEDLGRAARVLGRLTGTAPRADTLIRGLEAALDGVAAASGDAVRVLMVAWHNPPIVIGGTSFLSEIVARAGGSNVFGELEQPSATVSLEAIAASNPDVVLVVGQEGRPDFVDRPEWRAIEAVREGRFVVVDGTEFSWPSFRAPAAIARLRKALSAWRD